MTNAVETRDRKDGVTVVDPLERAVSREKTPEKKRGRRGRRSKAEEQSGTKCRFFLQAKPSNDGEETLALGEEMESEQQALVESLRREVPFLRVESWTAYAERQGADMVIRKRAQVE